MYHVVVAVDDDRTQASELADTVERLAEETNLKVTLVHVFRDVHVSEKVSIHQLVENYDELLEDAREVPLSVRETAERFESLDADVEPRVESGDPAEEVVRVAEDVAADAVYIGGRKTSPVGKVLFGSVAQDILFQTDLPVTISGTPDK